MECVVKFLDNPNEFYEPGQKLKAQIVITFAKAEKVGSEFSYTNFDSKA